MGLGGEEWLEGVKDIEWRRERSERKKRKTTGDGGGKLTRKKEKIPGIGKRDWRQEKKFVKE